MPLHSIDWSSRLSAVSNARIRMNGTARSSSSADRGREWNSAAAGVGAGAEHRHRQVAETRVLCQHRKEGVDRACGQAVADDDAVDLAGLKTAAPWSILSAPITPMRSPTATLNVAMVAAAPNQQHGRVIERVAGRHFGHDVAFGLQRWRGRTVECNARSRSAHETPRDHCSTAASSATVRASGSAAGMSSRTRMNMGTSGAAPASVAGDRPLQHRRRTRLGHHDGRGLDRPPRSPRRPRILDDRERAGVDKRLRQTAGGPVGDDKDRTLQRMANAIPACEGCNLRVRH